MRNRLRDRESLSGERSEWRRHLRTDPRGFTLLEVQIAVALIALIVLIVAGAMRLSLRSVSSGERRMEAQERLRMSLAILDAQLQSEVPLTYVEDGNKNFYFRGDGKNLRFATNYSIWGARRGFVVVEYRVDDDGSGRQVLYASERMPGLEGSRSTRLIDATEISFEYLYRNAPEEQDQWLEVFPGGDTIAAKVRMLVREGVHRSVRVFPLRVGGEITPIAGGAAKQNKQ